MSELEELKALVKDLTKRLEKYEKKPRAKKNSYSEENAKVRQFFLEQYQKHFGHEYPIWGAKENANIKRLVESCGLAKSFFLIRYYLIWQDPFVVQAGHPIGLLLTSVVKLEAQLMRKGKYFDDVVKSQIIKKFNIETRKDIMEIETNAELKARTKQNCQISFGHSGELPDQTKE